MEPGQSEKPVVAEAAAVPEGPSVELKAELEELKASKAAAEAALESLQRQRTTWLSVGLSALGSKSKHASPYLANFANNVIR